MDMDRRAFLAAGGGLAVLGGLAVSPRDLGSAVSEYMPAPVRTWDNQQAMPYWHGETCYQFDSSAGTSGRMVDAYLPDGLAGFWDFEDGSIDATDGVIVDRAPGQPANDGQIIGDGPPDLMESSVGQALKFGDGNTDYVRVPMSDALDVQAGDFTLAVRFRVEAFAGNSLISHKPGGAGDESMGYYLGVVGDGVYAARANAALAFVTGDGENDRRLTPTRAPVGPWLLVTARYNAGTHTARIGMNGMAVGEHSFSQPIDPTPADVLLGAHGTTDGMDRFLSGALSAVRIYDRELADGEIQALAALGGPAGPSFDVEFRQLILDDRPTRTNDAVGVYETGRSPPYLLSAWDGPSNQNNLYESANLTEWTLIAEDITGPYTLQDYVLANGTYWVYDSDDTSTRVWSGANFQNLTFEGVVLSGYSDVGAFYEDGKYYLYPEEEIEPGTPSGNKIGVWTSDRPDGGFSRAGTAIDFTDRPFVTGDADIEEINGVYWLFCDAEADHPYYGTALARSDDLVQWEFVTDDIKNRIGGDLDVLQTPDGLVGFTEFTESRAGGIGLWDVTPTTS